MVSAATGVNAILFAGMACVGIACLVAPGKVRNGFLRAGGMRKPWPEPPPGELLHWRLIGALVTVSMIWGLLWNFGTT
ncbi:MAG: hypothetical protein KIT09_07130 [Bryobacteraceae bacterium]|nr:hypothetical protein [Bryobacteraceae bacterium]